MEKDKYGVGVVGDNNVGKTSLLISYTTNEFPSEQIVKLSESLNYEASVTIDDILYKLDLFDTPKEDVCDCLKRLLYPNTEVLLVCFNVVNKSSYHSVKEKWIPEIKRDCPNAVYVIVGTKIDLRHDPSTLERLAENRQKPISLEEGKKLAKELKAVKYVECSALTQIGLKNVFDVAIKAKLREKNKKCIVL